MAWIRERTTRGQTGAAERPVAPPAGELRSRAPLADRFTLLRIGRLSRASFSALLSRCGLQARRGRWAGSLGELSHLAPLALSLAPYLVSLRSLHKDRDLLDAASLRFLGSKRDGAHGERRAWFTDSGAAPEEVAEKVRLLSRASGGRETALVAISRASAPPGPGAALASFAPLTEIPLPLELGGGTLSLPPLLEILDHCERERFGEIVLDGATPLALAGLVAGKLLGIRLVGLFDSDLPARLRSATDSATLEAMAWSYLRWFFGALDVTYVASRREQQGLVARGFDPRRLRCLASPRPAARGTEGESEREERMFALESLA